MVKWSGAYLDRPLRTMEEAHKQRSRYTGPKRWDYVSPGTSLNALETAVTQLERSTDNITKKDLERLDRVIHSLTVIWKSNVDT